MDRRTGSARGRDIASSAHLSPEDQTRRIIARWRASLLERLTVQRLSWDRVVRCNRYLELAGKLTTGIWVVFLVSLLLGFDWRQVVKDALNSGRPVEGAFVLAVLLPTLMFLAARSLIGFARWRLQRELWRRDVERLETGEASADG